MSRKLRDPSIDHEGDSCPAHRQAALTTRTRVLTDLSLIQDTSARKGLAGARGAPVRELECMSRLLKFLSADHEDGRGPAHHEAALTATMLACRAGSHNGHWFRKDDKSARRSHLSDCWSIDKGCSSFPAQTMRVAAALHTVRNIHKRGACSQSLELSETSSVKSTCDDVLVSLSKQYLCLTGMLYDSHVHTSGSFDA